MRTPFSALLTYGKGEVRKSCPISSLGMKLGKLQQFSVNFEGSFRMNTSAEPQERTFFE